MNEFWPEKISDRKKREALRERPPSVMGGNALRYVTDEFGGPVQGSVAGIVERCAVIWLPPPPLIHDNKLWGKEIPKRVLMRILMKQQILTRGIYAPDHKWTFRWGAITIKTAWIWNLEIPGVWGVDNWQRNPRSVLWNEDA